MAISMLKIRRPLGRLIFNMGVAIPGKTVFLIETAPISLQMCMGQTADRSLTRPNNLGLKTDDFHTLLGQLKDAI